MCKQVAGIVYTCNFLSNYNKIISFAATLRISFLIGEAYSGSNPSYFYDKENTHR